MSMGSLLGGVPLETHGPIAAASQCGPQLTTGIDTKGSWVQITAGLAFACAALHIMFDQFSAGNQRFAFDFGLGAVADPPTPVLENLLYMGTSQGPTKIDIALPAGRPICVRGQSTGAAINARCGIFAIPEGQGQTGIPRWTTYGMNVAGATAGVAVDAGAVADVLSGWIEIIAATLFPIRLIHILHAGATVSGNTNAAGLVDIGVGAGGSELVRLDRIPFRLGPAATSGWALGPYSVPSLPVGSRIAVRHQSNSNVVASARNMHWAILAGG
jgi:hypothetical protein